MAHALVAQTEWSGTCSQCTTAPACMVMVAIRCTTSQHTQHCLLHNAITLHHACVCCDVVAVFLSMPNLLWNTATMVLLLMLLVGIVNLDGHHIVSMHTHMPLVTCANVFCSLLPLVVVAVVHANAHPLPFSSSSHALPPPHTNQLFFVVVVVCGGGQVWQLVLCVVSLECALLCCTV